MTTNARSLPQLDDRLYLTDGGIETALIFQDGIDLPLFAAFPLLNSTDGIAALNRYYRRYIDVAHEAGTGFILESPMWRANADWALQLGYDGRALADINQRAIALMHELRAAYATPETPMVVSGCIGPRGDGYRPGATMTNDEATAYHGAQVRAFADAGVEQITAITINNTPEAIGVARAALASGLPSVISFTVETDGRLPTGQSLEEAIRSVDEATDAAPVYYMVTCAHPTHFDGALEGADWVRRIRGLRANASRCSHAELDEAEVLDEGNPRELGGQYSTLRERYPWINVLGGCCGTDHRHVREIAVACAA
jgi:S-methylmethionine-dependent homocysteine/selenocysteine methylase